jgi:predicted dehydrogenase
MAEFLRLVTCGSVQMNSLITHRFDISEATEAYKALEGKSKSLPIGIVLQYPSEVQAAKTIKLLLQSPRIRASRSGIAIGLIGAGIFARTTLLPELKKHSVFHFSGVATTSGSSAEHAARTFGFDYATADHKEILEDQDVSCVLIATRHDSHARLTADALRAGKDVFVEKPLAMTVTELLEVAEAWRSGDGRLMVGFNRRHSPHSRLAKDFLDSAGGPTLLHFRINAGEVARDSWVNDPLLGGDRVRGELCHFIDLAHYFLEEFPVAVDGRGLPAIQKENPVEDIVASVEFSSGSVANFVYTARGHRSLPREHIEGFRGGKVAVIENFRKTKFYGPGAPRTHRTWRLDRGYYGEFSAWAEALKEGKSAPVSFTAYAASTLVTLAVREAMASGSKVEIDQKILAECSLSR